MYSSVVYLHAEWKMYVGVKHAREVSANHWFNDFTCTRMTTLTAVLSLKRLLEYINLNDVHVWVSNYGDLCFQ